MKLEENCLLRRVMAKPPPQLRCARDDALDHPVTPRKQQPPQSMKTSRLLHHGHAWVSPLAQTVQIRHGRGAWPQRRRWRLLLQL